MTLGAQQMCGERRLYAFRFVRTSVSVFPPYCAYELTWLGFRVIIIAAGG